MGKNEKSGNGELPRLAQVIVILLAFGVAGYLVMSSRESSQIEHDRTAHGNVSEGKIIPYIDQPRKALVPCECKKEKKPKHKKSKPKVKPEPAPKTESMAEGSEKVLVEAPDFYDKAVMPKTWVAEPEEEVAPEPPPKVGRKIYVVRQPSPYYYGGGYGYNYGYGYTPPVIYGGTPTFVPNPPVIVPAPSVVAPPPSVVTPAGGYKPQGNTGGHSPNGVTL